VRARTGWMPDVFGTWDSLTCREVLATVADAYRVPRAVAATRIEDLLELVHLGDLADRPTQVLSRGQKQRLGLARALVNDPDVLLLDEPASGLSDGETETLSGVLGELAASGIAVLLVEHDVRLVMEVCSSIHVLDYGAMLAVGSPAAIRTDPKVLDAYLGTPLAGGGPG